VWLPPSPGSTAWRAQLDDPRWAGGPVSFFSFAPGPDQTDAFYRAVATYPNAPGVSQIYASIQVRLDADGPDPADSVFFGLTQGSAAAGAYLLQIFPEPSSTPPVDGGVPHDPQYPRPNSPSTISLYRRDPNPPHLWSLQGNPPWLKNVATWLGSPGVSWAITFQIDTSSSTGITLGNGAQVFFGTGINVGARTPIVWLTTAPQVAPDAGIGGTAINQDTSAWPQLPPQGAPMSPNPPPCVACPPGMAVFPYSIGVLVDGGLSSPDGGNPISTCSGCRNTFRVEVHNVPPLVGAAPFSIRARVRVADWASALGDPAAVWDPFGTPADVFSADRSAFTPDAGWRWGFDGGTDGGTVDIDFTCSVTDGGAYCPSPAPGTTQSRQIMLADIALDKDALGSGSIQHAQAYRDVNYQPPLPAPPIALDAGAVPITAVGPPAHVPPCNCNVVGGEGWSLAALGATGFGAALLAVRGLRRRRRPS
jgi:hypothetical protein